MLSLSAFMRRAIGVPFLKDGRDYDAWDCYGLAWCAYRDVAGVTLPRHDGEYTRDWKRLVRSFEDRKGGEWREIQAPQEMAIACIYRRGFPIHCGLVVPGRRILHVEEGVQTCMEPIRAFRVEGYYLPCPA